MKKALTKLRSYFSDQLDENSLPYRIGSKITIKQYNKFLEHQESSNYKYQRRNNVNYSPYGTGELIAADVAIYPNMNQIQQPRTPYPGPPPGIKMCF
ncbi:2293_t:CDS:2 [Cetraspora pellucida]|uniref:2293_t:CDS:1 n=1 Tax=Cetraspora pellucida TaxID=1433469 RepID=A0A9N9G507_9GLOM|nr:2293_t:CDS:2 [Cetraspora pellucida]